MVDERAMRTRTITGQRSRLAAADSSILISQRRLLTAMVRGAVGVEEFDQFVASVSVGFPLTARPRTARRRPRTH